MNAEMNPIMEDTLDTATPAPRVLDREPVVVADKSRVLYELARRVAVTDSASGKILAQAPAKFTAKTWLPVRACFRGNELIVQVADVTAKASSPLVALPKTAFAFMTHGEDIGFRKVQVHSAP